MRHNRNSAPFVQAFLRKRSYDEQIQRRDVPGWHLYKVYDLSMDVCAICRKPRKEHPHS